MYLSILLKLCQYRYYFPLLMEPVSCCLIVHEAHCNAMHCRSGHLCKKIYVFVMIIYLSMYNAHDSTGLSIMHEVPRLPLLTAVTLPARINDEHSLQKLSGRSQVAVSLFCVSTIWQEQSCKNVPTVLFFYVFATLGRSMKNLL